MTEDQKSYESLTEVDLLADQTEPGDGKFENVEFSMDLADAEDKEALRRAEAADRRAEQGE